MKKRNKEQKSMYHTEYGVWSNTLFVVKNMIGYDKKLLPIIMLGIFGAPFATYLWTFMSKFILDMVSNEGSVENLIWMIVIFAFLSLRLNSSIRKRKSPRLL